MLPQDCSCFHGGHYIICWQVPLKNEFTTLAKNVDIPSGRSLAAARARVGWFACPYLHAIYEPVPKFAPPHGDETLIEGYFPTFDR